MMQVPRLTTSVSFTNGIIEYDVAFTAKRNFIGVKFRQQDAKNSEEFYIRPHQSGNPDANQYTPIFNGLGCLATLSTRLLPVK